MSPQGPGRICVGVVSSCLVQCATVAVMKWGRAPRGALQPWLWPRPPRKVCQRALAPPVEVFAVPQFPSSTSNRAPLLEEGTAPASPRTVLYCRFSHQLNSHTGRARPMFLPSRPPKMRHVAPLNARFGEWWEAAFHSPEPGRPNLFRHSSRFCTPMLPTWRPSSPQEITNTSLVMNLPTPQRHWQPGAPQIPVDPHR